MPTTFELIDIEKIAAILGIISSFQILFSAFQAEKAELEKQRGATPSGSTTAAVSYYKLGLASTTVAAVEYALFLIVAVLRKW